MKIKSIKFRNIGPYGNNTQEFTFNDYGSLMAVLGSNGAGKSTFLNLTKFLLYGKASGLNKNDIANRFNKNGYIEGTIQVAPDVVCRIIRQFEPSKLYVEKNGEDIGKAGISDYQSYIDNEIVGLPYHIFSNIVSLSIDDFKSFLSMSPNDKRVIIDKIFSMEILNKLHELVKKDLRNIKYNLDVYDREINFISKSISSSTIELDNLRNKQKIKNDADLNSLKKEFSDIENKLNEVNLKVEEYQQKEKKINASLNKLNKIINDNGNILAQLNSQKQLYNLDKCPTCGSNFKSNDDINFDEIRKQINDKITLKNEENDKYKIILQKYKKASNELSKILYKCHSLVGQYQSQLKNINSKYLELSKNNDKEPETLFKIINDNKTKLKNIEQKKEEESEDIKYLEILEKMYSDDGVKRNVLENYLPILNKEIEYTLSELHFPYNLYFDSDFKPKLTHLGIEIRPETLSTGEHKRVDLAILVAILRMIKMKFPTLNTFTLDEVLSSIDILGVHDIIRFLQQTSKDLNINIFVVTHTSQLPLEYFNYKIEIFKNDGFSDLEITKLD